MKGFTHEYKPLDILTYNHPIAIIKDFSGQYAPTGAADGGFLLIPGYQFSLRPMRRNRVMALAAR